MSSVIHMETDQVRAVARQLSQASSGIQQDIISVGNRLRSLNWQSPRRDKFMSDFAELQRSVQAHAEMGVELGARMQREVDEWENIAASFGLSGMGPILGTVAAILTSAKMFSLTRPSPQNMQELAKMVSDLYTKDENGNYTPIRIVQIGPNEYLIMMAGSVGGQGANNWNSALYSGLGWPGDYLNQIKTLVLALPVGAVVNFAGHSQGGMMGNQLAVDAEVQSHVTVKSVTTFGSSVNAEPQDDVVYKRYAAYGDIVPLLSNEVLDVLAFGNLQEKYEEMKDLGQQFIPGPGYLNYEDAHGVYGSSEALMSESLPFKIDQWNNGTTYAPDNATGSLPIVDVSLKKILSGGW